MKAKPRKRESPQEWFKPHIEALGKTLDSYEAAHPHWFADTVFELIGGALRSLRHYIEAPREKTITWNRPFVELHYPVQWNWDAWRSGDDTQIFQIFGTLTAEDLCSRRRAIRVLSRIAVETRNVFVLNALTKHAAWEKRRGHWTPILSPEIGEALSKLPDRRQRQALTELYRPFSVGAFEVAYDAGTLRSGDRTPIGLRKALAQGAESLDTPPLTLTGTIDGKPFTLSVIAQFRALVVDVDKHRAYFPITAGLVFHPEIIERTVDRAELPMIETNEPNPAIWCKKDRAIFWEILLQAWDDATKPKQQNGTPSARKEETVVELMFKARLVPSDEESRPTITNALVDSLRRHGRIKSISFDLREATGKSMQAADELERKAESRQFDVFLAHNSKDKQSVARVAKHLEHRGIYPWFDQDQIPPGRRFQEYMQGAIGRVRAVAVFIGPHGLGPWQDLELQASIQKCVRKKTPVIPVLLPGINKIPKRLSFLSEFGMVRFVRRLGEQKALGELQWAITGQKPSAR